MAETAMAAPRTAQRSFTKSTRRPSSLANHINTDGLQAIVGVQTRILHKVAHVRHEVHAGQGAQEAVATGAHPRENARILPAFCASFEFGSDFIGRCLSNPVLIVASVPRKFPF
eukprot:scaffold2797_cov234-Pinguiococcus_pyrenoidosus.AAC.4